MQRVFSLLTICLCVLLTRTDALATADVEAWVHATRKRLPYSLAPGITAVVVRYAQPTLIHRVYMAVTFSSNNPDCDTDSIPLTYCNSILPIATDRRTLSEVVCSALVSRQRRTRTL